MGVDFPARVVAERQRLGLTQEEAAMAIDVSRNTYKRLERATRDPHLSTLAKLVRAGFRLEAIAPELFEP
jgi:transcriptional regulator with XRE-family HTH domain